MPSITNGILTVNFSISDKDASGNFTITATIRNTSTNTRAVGNPRLSCSLDNASNWKRIETSAINAGNSYSGSVSFSTGSTGAGTVYCFLLSDYLSGLGGAYSVGGYNPPIPDFEKVRLSISQDEAVMGAKITISESGGVGVSSISRRWSCGGQTGSFTTGQWEVSIDDFEPLTINSNSIVATFTTSSSGAGGSGSSSDTVRLRVPANYVPSAEHEYEFIDSVNNALIAGRSKLKVTINPSVTPEGNHATIASCELLRVNSTNPNITVNSFTKNNNVYTSSILPPQSNVPSYNLSLTFRITDSRGNVLDYTTESFRVTNFIPPYVEITNLKRETATRGRINISINSPSAAHLARLKVGTQIDVSVINYLVPTSEGYTLDYEILGLLSGTQYSVVFTYQDENMYSYGESPYSYSKLLSTLEMPLSLYDDGAKMYISFGEECSDDYGEDYVVNFAKDVYLRYIDDNDNVVCEKVQDILNSCPYGVGDILQTTNETNPSQRWQGTSWEQIQGRVLVGVGTDTDDRGGSKTFALNSEGGEYTHQLTVNEMPSHTHSYANNDGSCDRSKTADLKTTGVEWTVAKTTGATGGNQPHNNMPPYRAVYMWIRTA